MHSSNGAWVLCYNGEIYNAAELKRELPGVGWRGRSDSEVLIEAIAHWGLEKTLRRIIGMFAFAAFDTTKQQLWLCRDRLGIKPLYYGWVGNNFVFSSELRAIKSSVARPPLNHDAIASFLRYGYIPGASSIFAGINKLRPGQMLLINSKNLLPETPLKPARFWNLRDHAEKQVSMDEVEALTELRRLMRSAVDARMIADVPVGAFLSGGYDSSLICALMQEQSNKKIKTYTIGFDDPRYNEAEQAKTIAQHLGTDHTEFYVEEQDVLSMVAKLPELCDEPFGDSSILPTSLVCSLAKAHLSVALSGDGGDELFWGYKRYYLAERMWKSLTVLPLSFRRASACVLASRLIQNTARSIPAPSWGGREGSLDQKLASAGEMLGSLCFPDLYNTLLSKWRNPMELCLYGKELTTPYNDADHWTRRLEALPQMGFQDTLAYLPDDILTKVDRSSMQVSLEVRVPLLDHRVVEFVTGLPAHLKYRNGQSKYLLRRLLSMYIPETLTNRPKMGFGVPLDKWLRGPLKEIAEDLLTPDLIRRQGILHPEPIQHLLNQHTSGSANNAAKLWNILVLQSWLQN